MGAAGLILIVEDDEVAREGLSTILGRAGYEVVSAANGKKALKLLQTGTRPVLVLLDMMLPVCDGWRFLRDPATKGFPVVIMTGLDIASAEWAASLGAVGYLHKPFDADTVVKELARHV